MELRILIRVQRVLDSTARRQGVYSSAPPGDREWRRRPGCGR
jgi:hypothetical protein